MTERTVTVHLNLAVSRFLRNGKQSEDQIARVRRETERLNLAASAFTKSGLAASMAGLPSVLTPAAAGLAALPALAFSGASAFGVLAISVNGVGDAIKAVHDGDPKKLAETLSKLSSEARAFVAEYARVKPHLDQLGDSAQGALFRPLLGDLEQLAGVWMPVLMDKVPRLAAELGEAGDDLAGWATSVGTVKKISGQIDLAAETTQDWAAFLREGLNLMLELADSARPFTRWLVHGLAEGTASMGRFVREARAAGQMDQLFDNSKAALEGLGEVAAEAGDLLFDVLSNPSLVFAAETLFGVLHMGLQIVHGVVNVFSLLPAPVQAVIATFLTIGGIALLLAGRIAALKAALATASINFGRLGLAGEDTGRRLERGARMATRAAAGYAGLAAIGGLAKELRSTGISVDSLSGALERFGSTGERSSAIAAQFGADLETLQHDIDRASLRGLKDLKGGAHIEGLTGNVSSLFTSNSEALTLDRITTLDQALANLVRSGNAKAAADAVSRLKISQEQAAKILPEYTAAVENAGTATGSLGRAQRASAMNAAILNAGLAGAVEEAGSLIDVFDRLRGGVMTFAEAEIDAEEAIDRLSESLKETDKSLKKNGAAFDVNTEKGRENKQNLLAGVQAAITTAQAKYDLTVATEGETVALQKANADYQAYIARLREAMLASGMNKTVVDELLKTYAAMPPLIATSVTTPGLDTAIAKTLRLLELRRLLGSNVAAANAYGNTGYTSGRRWGGFTEHARDGLLREAGVFSSAYPARYAFAEPQTGGEAFVPRNGDYERSMSILERAAGWYGAMIVPGGRGDVKSAKQSGVSAADFGRAVRSAMHGMAVVLDGRVVGRMQGGQSDLLRRGG